MWGCFPWRCPTAAEGDAPPGVTLEALLELRKLAEHHSHLPGPARTWRPWDPAPRAAGEPLTTADLCFEAVKPLTEDIQDAYIHRVPKRCVRPRATVFVSHAWAGNFVDLVDTIVHAALPSEEVYWVDLIMNSQWDTQSKPFEWWEQTFTRSVGSIGKTVLVATPWERPTALTRAWCLLEIHATVASGGQLVVQLPPSEEARFEQHVSRAFDDVVHFISSLRMSQANASNPTDLDNIRALVAGGAGFQVVDEQVMALMRSWLMASGRRALARAGPGRDAWALANQLSGLSAELSLGSEARSLAEQALAGARADGDELGATAALVNLGNALRLEGDAEGALVHFRACHAAYTDHGQDEDAMLALNNVVGALFQLGRFGEAEGAYAQVVAFREHRYGAKDAKTLNALANRAAALGSMMRHEESLSLQERVAEGLEEVLGEDHPDALRAKHNYASALASAAASGEVAGASLEGALVAMHGAFQGRTRALGTWHRDTLSSAVSYGGMLAQAGAHADAEAVLSAVLAGAKGGHAPELPKADVALATGSLADAVAGLGRKEEAVGLYREAIAMYDEAFGADHPTGLLVVARLAQLLMEEEDTEGRVLMARARDGFARALGADHPFTRQAAEELVVPGPAAEAGS